jgi:hypothetical protein
MIKKQFNQNINITITNQKDIIINSKNLSSVLITMNLIIKKTFFNEFVKYFKTIFGLKLKILKLEFEIPIENKEFMYYFETIKNYEVIEYNFSYNFFKARNFEIKSGEIIKYEKDEYKYFKNSKNTSINITEPIDNEFLKDISFDFVKIFGVYQKKIYYSKEKILSIQSLKDIDFSFLNTKEIEIFDNYEINYIPLIDYLENTILEKITLQKDFFRNFFFESFVNNHHKFNIKTRKIKCFGDYDLQSIFDCFNYITIDCSITKYFSIVINNKNKNITLDEIVFNLDKDEYIMIEFLNKNKEIKTIGVTGHFEFDISKFIFLLNKLKYVEKVIIYKMDQIDVCFELKNVLFYSVQRFSLHFGKIEYNVDIYNNTFSFYSFLHFDLNFLFHKY